MIECNRSRQQKAEAGGSFIRNLNAKGKVKRKHPLSSWGRGRGADAVGVSWAMTSFDGEASRHGVGETGRRRVCDMEAADITLSVSGFDEGNGEEGNSCIHVLHVQRIVFNDLGSRKYSIVGLASKWERKTMKIKIIELTKIY
jgi:hypothetical protein